MIIYKCQYAFVCVCYDQKRHFCNSNSTINKMQINSITLHSFPFSFNFTKPYLPGSEKFWMTEYKKCQCAIVCVCYVQNDPLIIVIQLKKNMYIVMTTIHSFSFRFNFSKQSLSGSNQFWITDYGYVLICISVLVILKILLFLQQ